MVDFFGVLVFKKKYKFFLYVDEVYSIGVFGFCGCGVCDYFGVDLVEIDIFMGILIKFFGVNGGYVVVEKYIIDKFRSINVVIFFGEFFVFFVFM